MSLLAWPCGYLTSVFHTMLASQGYVTLGMTMWLSDYPSSVLIR